MLELVYDFLNKYLWPDSYPIHSLFDYGCIIAAYADKNIDSSVRDELKKEFIEDRKMQFLVTDFHKHDDTNGRGSQTALNASKVEMRKRQRLLYCSPKNVQGIKRRRKYHWKGSQSAQTILALATTITYGYPGDGERSELTVFDEYDDDAI